MRTFILLLVIVLFAGCNNHPVESEICKFTMISRGDVSETGECWITFTYEGGHKNALLSSQAQWLRIIHLRVQDWQERKNIKYTLNYRNGKLLSFYKQE